MLDEILTSVKGGLGSQLSDKLGMSSDESDKSFGVLKGSLQKVL